MCKCFKILDEDCTKWFKKSLAKGPYFGHMQDLMDDGDDIYKPTLNRGEEKMLFSS